MLNELLCATRSSSTALCCARAASKRARSPRVCAPRKRRPSPPGADPLQPECPKSRRMTAGHFPLEMVADDGVPGRHLWRDRDSCRRARRPRDGGAALGTRQPPLAGRVWPVAVTWSDSPVSIRTSLGSDSTLYAEAGCQAEASLGRAASHSRATAASVPGRKMDRPSRSIFTA